MKQHVRSTRARFEKRGAPGRGPCPIEKRGQTAYAAVSPCPFDRPGPILANSALSLWTAHAENRVANLYERRAASFSKPDSWNTRHNRHRADTVEADNLAVRLRHKLFWNATATAMKSAGGLQTDGPLPTHGDGCPARKRTRKAD